MASGCPRASYRPLPCMNAPLGRALRGEVNSLAALRCADQRRRPLPAHLRLLELGLGDGAVERGAQLLGALERQLDARTRARIERGVDEVERDDVAERRMPRVVIGDHGVREEEPLVAALAHPFGW